MATLSPYYLFTLRRSTGAAGLRSAVVYCHRLPHIIIMTKAAIYVRVSKTDQTPENQLIPLTKYADMNNWDTDVYTEKESTRKTRPIQWGLYNQLLKRKYDVLLFYKFDRWARSLRELVTHMEELTEKGVRVVSYSENVDLGTSTGRLMFNIIGAMAEFERDLIRERTLAGLARARAQGKTLGRPRKKRAYTKP